jgi:hypothetical protein
MAGFEDEDHAAMVVFNIAGYMHTLSLFRTGVLSPDLNDLPSQRFYELDSWVNRDTGKVPDKGIEQLETGGEEGGGVEVDPGPSGEPAMSMLGMPGAVPCKEVDDE